ncbi:unnamed protein product [Adineta ricciae]|uniref:Calcineurin-like phosphoesterase domain-containing protein n=1 Tax=Adineta ricciae TaxID=249248 RepID=A0A814QGV7_ADIRI|nr:unnamed protein product [Adineta ricciae]CAF1120166.1 unnamed protein product [Adineta ricciae]
MSEESKPIFQTMLMSDLHLEFPNAIVPEFNVVAPNLILAGDIGRPDIPSLSAFLLAQCDKFEHIFYVAGNHCFYGGEYQDRLEQLHALNKMNPRIHFLHNQTYLLPNKVRILGTTLWSYVSELTASKVGRFVNDYYQIKLVDETESRNKCRTVVRRLTVDDTNAWHAEQHTWLLEEIRKARENQEHVIIITHHAPSRRETCTDEDAESGVADAFVNDHDEDCQDPVRLWVYGHTHLSTNLMINSTKVVSNQRGYVHENCGFRPNMKINLFDNGTVTVTDS